MYTEAIQSITDASRIMIIQAENPDGDSLGSALALEGILTDLGKTVTMHCPVAIPNYMRYFPGWDRVTDEFDSSCDLAIIVDTTAEILLSKTLEIAGARHFLETHPVVVLDHHDTPPTLTFDHIAVIDTAVSATQVIHQLAKTAKWSIRPEDAEHLLAGLMSDSLGLTTQSVTADSYHTAGELTALGASNNAIETRRREFMKKSPEILAYKGRLLERIEYHCNGRLALVHIPWEEIQEYSNEYNPSVLALDEMRLVHDVEVAIAIKTYPDGKLTGKIRSNSPISEVIAGYFGGGGHAYASGFRIFESYDTTLPELITATEKALDEHTAN